MRQVLTHVGIVAVECLPLLRNRACQPANLQDSQGRCQSHTW